MSRSNNHNDTKTREPSWEDVLEAVRWLQKATKHHIQVVTTTADHLNSPAMLRIEARAIPFGEGVNGRPVERVWKDWPTLAHRTMPACYLALLHSLDHMLYQRAKSLSEDGNT